MEQKLIKGFVAFSAIIICQQRMCCLNMFVIIRNALLSGIVGRFRRAFVQMMKQ